MGNYSPLFQSLFPVLQRIIPSHNVTSDYWVEANSTLFNTQWIDCTYPISGGYGKGPRYLYYILVLVALFGRRRLWLARVALGSVMTYSSTAAVHSICLAVARTKMVPQAYVGVDYAVVLAGGTSLSGIWVWPTKDSWQETGLWLPVLPMVWDGDGDAVLAIVGVAFLVMTPMQTWSSTFKQLEAKAVLLLWSLLLFIGIVSALVNEAYIVLWGFNQLRFCPPQLNDTLPLTNNGAEVIGGSWDGIDRYHWNKTITRHFLSSPDNLSTMCIYPCFGTEWPLRDPIDIVAVPLTSENISSYNTMFSLFFGIYLCIVLSSLSSFTIFAVAIFERKRKRTIRDIQTLPVQDVAVSIIKPRSALDFVTSSSFFHAIWDPVIIEGLKHDWRAVRNSRPIASFNFTKHLSTAVYHTWLQVVTDYAIILSFVTLIVFAGSVEYMIRTDEQGETFRHVGQWGAVVAAGFVLIIAIVDQVRENFDSLLRPILSQLPPRFTNLFLNSDEPSHIIAPFIDNPGQPHYISDFELIELNQEHRHAVTAPILSRRQTDATEEPKSADTERDQCEVQDGHVVGF